MTTHTISINKIISLGVGIQSSALYYMSSMGELPEVDMAIFADTGGEKTKTLEYYYFLLNWKEQNNGLPLYRANYKNLYEDLLNKQNSNKNRFSSIPAYTVGKDNKVGMLRRQCTGEYKIAQVTKKYREILGIGNKRLPITEVWNGITLDEMHRMRIPQEKWKIYVYPFCGYKIYPNGITEKMDIDFIKTRNDILNWYKRKNLPIPEKSSCFFCPFMHNNNWRWLKSKSPEDFKKAVEIDYIIRDSTKQGVNNPIFLHESLLPLDKVDFNEAQLNIWGDCMDACDI